MRNYLERLIALYCSLLHFDSSFVSELLLLLFFFLRVFVFAHLFRSLRSCDMVPISVSPRRLCSTYFFVRCFSFFLCATVRTHSSFHFSSISHDQMRKCKRYLSTQCSLSRCVQCFCFCSCVQFVHTSFCCFFFFSCIRCVFSYLRWFTLHRCNYHCLFDLKWNNVS